MGRSASPTPSTRDLIRSYTTSSDESAAERIAAARAAREQRRRERETPRDDTRDDDGDAEAPRGVPPTVEVHEADSQDGRSSFGGAGDEYDEDRTTSSLVPKLRVKPTSSRSYTPSVPSTPSRSQPSSSPHASPAGSYPEHDPVARATSQTHPSATATATARRTSYDVGDIPPFRPQSASPVPSPSTSSPAATPPPTLSRSPSPGHVALAGGLMERLKAQRAAKLAAEAQAKPPEPGPPARSEAGSSALYTPLSEELPPLPHDLTPPTSPSQEPTPLDAIGVDPAASTAHQPSPSSPPPSDSSPGPSTEAPLLKSRRTVPCKVLGRDGEEVNFEFTQLSDVPEQTERSSLSTWRDSVHQHRRHGSISPAGRPVSSTFSVPVPSFSTQPRRFSLASSTSSLGRQRADGSFALPSRARPVLPSSWSARSTLPEMTSPASEVDARSFDPVDQRVDATSHILGRSGSASSIFPASSRSSSTSSSVMPSSAPVMSMRLPSPPARNSSPTRRVSPEVARRAAQFAQVDIDAPPPSPTKASWTRASSPLKRPALARDLPLFPPSASTSAVAPITSPHVPSADADDDSLVAIKRRRDERRQAIEAFRTQLAQDPPPPTEARPSGVVVPAPSSSSGSFDQGRDALTSSDFAGGASVRSPSPETAILCEGTLYLPPRDANRAVDHLERSDWSRRYCVLTSTALEYRPTDQDPGVRPTAVFRLSECACDEDEAPADPAMGLRPFAVTLKAGGWRFFACENRVERVKWVSALREAFVGTARKIHRVPSSYGRPAPRPDSPSGVEKPESTRTLTPPGSRYLSTKGTVRSWGPSPPPFSPGAYGLYTFADDKRPVPVVNAASNASSSTASSRSYLPEKATANHSRYDRDLFAMYSSRALDNPAISAVTRPSSIRSTGSDRSLPPLPPPKDNTALPHLGHRRTQSDVSAYNTPADQPPFRPKLTRPIGTSSGPSSPQKLVRQLSASSASYVSPTEVAALERELRAFGDAVELKESGRIKRDERYRRVQDRLQLLQRKLGSATSVTTGSSSSLTKTDELALAEKVDYLLHVTREILQKQTQERGPPAPTTLINKDEQIASLVEARIRDLLHNMGDPAARPPRSSPSTVKARAEPDTATVTTRAGIHSPSERIEWKRDLERFKHDAMSTSQPPASSAASPNTVLRERERASRKLQNLSPLSPNQLEPFTSSGSLFGEPAGRPPRARDPFAGSGVVVPTEVEALRELPPPAQLHPHQQQPSLRSFGEWGGVGSSKSAVSWAEGDVSRVEQTLFRILDGFEQQNGSLAQNQAHQERIAQVIGELAKWVAEDRSLRDAQFHELAGAVRGVVEHVSELPQRLLASLGVAEATEEAAPRPTVDRSAGDVDVDGPVSAADATLKTANVDEQEQHETVAGDGTSKKRNFGINPLSSFAQLDRKLVRAEASAADGRVKGPRMPGIRLWGAPVPVAVRANRWGGGAVAAKQAGNEQATEEALLADAEAAKDPNGPVVEALKKDEKLGQALQAIADGSGDEVDAGTLSLAVFEILQTMRDISKKQADQEAREKAEREKFSGLTLKEKAELEAKRAEIARLERDTAINAERTAKINEMVAQLAMKTEKADELLTQIARNVQQGKTTTMDPALSNEVKKLLGGVRTGVDEHVKDFRGQLTSEVQRMFKEVGKLRDEKKALQADIAELMAFHAKQGGAAAPASKAAVASPSAAPPPAAAQAATPSKPGLPSSGFFGPRAMK